MRRIGPILAFALVLGLAATAARANHQGAILGTGGELYLVKSGTFGDLFPGRQDTDPINSVLRLDVVAPDGSVQSSLVPGTQGPEVESAPFLQYEEASHTVYLIWETRINVIHPILMLSGFNGGWMWNEPIEIVGNPFAPKTSPQLTVTHDTFEEKVDGTPVTRHRSILHAVWGEETGSGSIETYYTPIILEDGLFTGRSPVFRLNDLDTAASVAGASALSPDLLQTLRIQPGRDERTVVVGFVSPRTGRLVTVEIDSLPPQLVQLADGARSHIVDIGARLYPSQIDKLAEEARSHIVDIGVAFHPEVLRSIADDVKSYLETEGRRGGDLQVIADGARSHIVDIGAKLSGRGLRGTNAASTVSDIIEVVPDTQLDPPEDKLDSHLLQLRKASDRPAPGVGRGEVILFVSENGQNVIVAWVEADRVLYRESSGAGWRDPLEVRLTQSMDVRQVLEILEQRVRHR
jgi:hypothetical protein